MGKYRSCVTGWNNTNKVHLPLKHNAFRRERQAIANRRLFSHVLLYKSKFEYWVNVLCSIRAQIMDEQTCSRIFAIIEIISRIECSYTHVWPVSPPFACMQTMATCRLDTSDSLLRTKKTRPWIPWNPPMGRFVTTSEWLWPPPRSANIAKMVKETERRFALRARWKSSLFWIGRF